MVLPRYTWLRWILLATNSFAACSAVNLKITRHQFTLQIKLAIGIYIENIILSKLAILRQHMFILEKKVIYNSDVIFQHVQGKWKWAQYYIQCITFLLGDTNHTIHKYLSRIFLVCSVCFLQMSPKFLTKIVSFLIRQTIRAILVLNAIWRIVIPFIIMLQTHKCQEKINKISDVHKVYNMILAALDDFFI